MKQENSNLKGWLQWPALAFAFVSPVWAAAQGSTTPAVPQAPAASHLNQADQSIRFYQAQVARDPDYWTSYNRLASAYFQKARETGDISYFELAEASLLKSLKIESTHVEAAPAYTQLAAVHLAEHRFSESADDAKHALALIPKDLSAMTYAGDAQIELGNYDAAQKFYDGIAVPDDGRPHLGIAYLSASHGAGLDWVKGDVSKASDDLERAIALSKEIHLPAENIAWTEFMRGEQFIMMGDLPAAEHDVNASLEAFPRYHRALAAMGQIRAAQGRFSESIAFYKQAIAIIPLPLYIGALGDVYLASGDKANAEKQFTLVQYIGKLSAINQQVYNRELATFYADHDRKLPEALILARKELEVRHDVYTSDALAWVLLKNHQLKEARDAIEQALRMGTRDALMEYHAGMIDAALGDKEKAKAHLSRALAISPHFHVIFAPETVKTLAALGANPAASVAASGPVHAN